MIGIRATGAFVLLAIAVIEPSFCAPQVTTDALLFGNSSKTFNEVTTDYWQPSRDFTEIVRVSQSINVNDTPKVYPTTPPYETVTELVHSTPFYIKIYRFFENVIDKFSFDRKPKFAAELELTAASKPPVTDSPFFLLKTLQFLVPSSFPKSIFQLADSVDGSLETNHNNDGNTSFFSIFDFFQKSQFQDLENNATALLKETAQSMDEISQFIDQIERKFRKHDSAQKCSVEELCGIFENYISLGVGLTNKGPSKETGLSDSSQSTDSYLMDNVRATVEVVCSETSKQLLKKLESSKDDWQNKMTAKLLKRVVDKVSKKNRILNSILNLLLVPVAGKSN